MKENEFSILQKYLPDLHPEMIPLLIESFKNDHAREKALNLLIDKIAPDTISNIICSFKSDQIKSYNLVKYENTLPYYGDLKMAIISFKDDEFKRVWLIDSVSELNYEGHDYSDIAEIICTFKNDSYKLEFLDWLDTTIIECDTRKKENDEFDYDYDEMFLGDSLAIIIAGLKNNTTKLSEWYRYSDDIGEESAHNILNSFIGKKSYHKAANFFKKFYSYSIYHPNPDIPPSKEEAFRLNVLMPQDTYDRRKQVVKQKQNHSQALALEACENELSLFNQQKETKARNTFLPTQEQSTISLSSLQNSLTVAMANEKTEKE